MLELTTKFSGISTSRKARNSLSPAEAAGKAAANLRYITRASAAEEVQFHGNFRNADGSRAETPRERKAAMRRELSERSQRGGKSGVRVAEKVIFSLPNDFTEAAQKQALNLICRRLGEDSTNILIVGAIHRDKKENLHGHLLVKDGLETKRAARLRNPDAKRIRRKEVLRMGDLGRPKELRALFAECINTVAERHGLTHVEHRSFETRGISLEPTEHEGPQRRGRTARTGKRDAVQDRNATRRAQPRRTVPGRRAGIPSTATTRKAKGALTAALEATEQDKWRDQEDGTELLGDLLAAAKRGARKGQRLAGKKSKPAQVAHSVPAPANDPEIARPAPIQSDDGMSPIGDIFGGPAPAGSKSAQSAHTVPAQPKPRPKTTPEDHENAIAAANAKARAKAQKKLSRVTVRSSRSDTCWLERRYLVVR